MIQPCYFLWKENLKKNHKIQKAVIYLELINWTAISQQAHYKYFHKWEYNAGTWTLLQKKIYLSIWCAKETILTKCSRLQVLLDCTVRENSHKSPVVKKHSNVKLSTTVIYLGIGLELSMVCMSSPSPFNCSNRAMPSRPDNLVKTRMWKKELI